MSSNHYHLAQYNIIQLKEDINHPLIKEFKDFLEPVNLLAEQSPGFIWRLTGGDGASATEVETLYTNPLIFINLSVWENVDLLKAYTYKTVHSYFLKSRGKWGDNMSGHQSVLWWTPVGAMPTPAIGKTKLDLLNDKGPTEEAFGMADTAFHRSIKTPLVKHGAE